MKRSTITALLCCLFSITLLQAQRNSIYIGANAGGNFSKFKFTEDLAELYPSARSVFGLNGGVDFGFEIQNFTVSTGIQYFQKGGEYNTDNFQDDVGTGFFSAQEKLHFLAIPIMVGYRKYWGEHFGLSFQMGPSINLGLAGKIDEETEYFGSEEVQLENYTVSFGDGVNDDYRNVQTSFRISPGMVFPINDQSKITFNVIWDIGLGDSFNERYKKANDFFDTYKGTQKSRSTMFALGYEYHFALGDRY